MSRLSIDEQILPTNKNHHFNIACLYKWQATAIKEKNGKYFSINGFCRSFLSVGVGELTSWLLPTEPCRPCRGGEVREWSRNHRLEGGSPRRQ